MICPDCSTDNPAAAAFCRQCGKRLANKPLQSGNLIRFGAAAVLSAMGVIFVLAGLVEGQALAFAWAVPFLGVAYWLFTKR